MVPEALVAAKMEVDDVVEVVAFEEGVEFLVVMAAA